MNGNTETWHPQRHRVIGIRWCWGDLNREPCDLDGGRFGECTGCWQMATGERGVFRHPICAPEADIDVAIRAVSRKLHCKLLHETSAVGRRNFGCRAAKIALDPFMTPDDLNRLGVKDRLCSAYIVKMGVDDRNDRGVTHRAKFNQCVTHFLD